MDEVCLLADRCCHFCDPFDPAARARGFGMGDYAGWHAHSHVAKLASVGGRWFARVCGAYRFLMQPTTA